MSYHKLMMENHTMFSRKVFERLSDRCLSVGQPKVLEYLYFNETDNAKRSSLPNEYLGVYLDVGCSVECQVGYFVPKNEESDASKLFFELGPNPDKVQYIYPR